MGSYIAILIVGFLWLLTSRTDESNPFYKRVYSLTGTFVLFVIFTWFIVTWCSEIISTPDHRINEHDITTFQKEDSSFVVGYDGKLDRFKLNDSNLKIELDTFHQRIRIKDYQQFTKWFLYGPRPDEATLFLNEENYELVNSK